MFSDSTKATFPDELWSLKPLSHSLVEQALLPDFRHLIGTPAPTAPREHQ
jgi:hypothetical protein